MCGRRRMREAVRGVLVGGVVGRRNVVLLDGLVHQLDLI